MVGLPTVNGKIEVQFLVLALNWYRLVGQGAWFSTTGSNPVAGIHLLDCKSYGQSNVCDRLRSSNLFVQCLVSLFGYSHALSINNNSLLLKMAGADAPCLLVLSNDVRSSLEKNNSGSSHFIGGM